MTNGNRIWLDSAATTPLAPEVIEAMQPWLTPGVAANASSLHTEGRAARRAIEDTRDMIAEFFAVPASQITFTSSATESNNLALNGVIQALPTDKRPHCVVSSLTEHPSVLKCLAVLEQRDMIVIDWLEVDENGRVDLNSAERVLSRPCALLSLMQINNETGIIQPLDEVARLARAGNPDVVVHCDAVQAAARNDRLGASADLVTLSGHKIHAPTGVGLLVRRRTVPISPLIHGGSQEIGLRAGTESPALIVGLGKAMALVRENQSPIASHLDHLAATIVSTLRSEGADFERIGDEANCAPGFLSLLFPQMKAEDLVIAADLEGVAISSGSACSSGTPERSHVLSAMGLSDFDIEHIVRLVPHRFQSASDVAEGACRLAQVLNRAK